MSSLPANVRVFSALEANDAGFSVANERYIAALSRAEDRHFWHRSRNRMIADRLGALGLHPPARILELGCGGGAVAASLSRAGYRVTGVDGHVSRVLQAAARAPEAEFIVHDLRGGAQGLFPEPFDAVGLFDVIEHLDDPGAALQEALALVRPRGVLVGTVPALMSLWSDVDVHARHRLRYEAGPLATLLGGVSGGTDVQVRHFNRLLVPMLWLQRKVVVSPDVAETAESNFKVPPAPLNAALYAFLRAEHHLAPLLDRTPLPGASLWFSVRRTGL
jgi:SAM-dependent methyltransferase